MDYRHYRGYYDNAGYQDNGNRYAQNQRYYDGMQDSFGWGTTGEDDDYHDGHGLEVRSHHGSRSNTTRPNTTRSSTTTLFNGASNFVIDGGTFLNASNGSYTEFSYDCRSPPSQPYSSHSRTDIYRGASNFHIMDNRPEPEGGYLYEVEEPTHEGRPGMPTPKRNWRSSEKFDSSRMPHPHSGPPASRELQRRIQEPSFPRAEHQRKLLLVPPSPFGQNVESAIGENVTFPTAEHHSNPNDMPKPQTQNRKRRKSRNILIKPKKHVNTPSNAQGRSNADLANDRLHLTTSEFGKLTLGGTFPNPIRSTPTMFQPGGQDSSSESPSPSSSSSISSDGEHGQSPSFPEARTSDHPFPEPQPPTSSIRVDPLTFPEPHSFPQA